MKRRYYDASDEYKTFVNLDAEDDVRSGQPYGDISVNINFSIFNVRKEE